MSATITDYFNKASNMSGSYPAVATVTAARSTGGSTLSCDDLSSWATDTPVHFSTFKVNTDGTIDTATQTDWKGIVNGNTITDMTRLAGAADSGNASGDRVELNPTIGWLDDLITGILVSHKQNGALKDNAVTESSIATGAVTNTKLGDGSVTSAKIGTGAISSYDKIGDDVIQARNIDTSTFPTQRLTFSSKDTTMSGTTIVTYTAPEDGVYLISANVCFQRNGGENTELLLWSTRNGDSLGNIGAYVVNDNRRTPVSGTWIVNASKNDVIKVGATSVYGNIWTRSDFSEIYMTRIA
jgi:hypothetical protein